MKIRVRAIDAPGFYRCGRFFPVDGIVLDKAELEDVQWKTLQSEPRLRLEPVADEEASTIAETEGETVAAITAALVKLDSGDYGNDGKPKVNALQALLPDHKITASLRDAAWSAAQEQ